MYKFISKSIEDTMAIASKLATKLNKSDIIVLTGQIGAGKTYFTKGILKNFISIDEVASPTFTIVNEYNTNPPIYHFDVYRLESEEEFLSIGGEEYIYNGISVIEWGEKILNVLPNQYIQITFNKIDENTRELIFEPHSEKYEKYIKELF